MNFSEMLNLYGTILAMILTASLSGCVDQSGSQSDSPVADTIDTVRTTISCQDTSVTVTLTVKMTDPNSADGRTKTIESLPDGKYKLVQPGHWAPGSKKVQDMGTYGLYKADSTVISGWKLARVFGDTSFTDIKESKANMKPEIWLRQGDGSVVRYGEVSEREGDNW
jgi:hypothetical protein